MVRIEIVGKRDSYWVYTVKQWLYEIKDVIEREIGEEVYVTETAGDNEYPLLRVDGEMVGYGVPGEEGYLIEIIKHSIEELRKRRKMLRRLVDNVGEGGQ
ncbi:MAG: hypothetical protein DRO14_04230 [Thermoprotei archaeon]|nr:MAG: hypothetical protein DRO14_04230 [Thermoprotei archaeon]